MENSREVQEERDLYASKETSSNNSNKKEE